MAKRSQSEIEAVERRENATQAAEQHLDRARAVLERPATIAAAYASPETVLQNIGEAEALLASAAAIIKAAWPQPPGAGKAAA
jgi:hypothetical protein